MSEQEEPLARLEAVRARRGWLLPHHGLMAIAAPSVLAGYEAAYQAIALEDRVLTRHDREFVWLAVLAATDEGLATHHVAKFREAGGSDAGIGQAFAACAWALGGRAHAFAFREWAEVVAPWSPREAYVAGVRALAPLRLVHLAQAAVQACAGQWALLEWQIVAAYEDGVPEAELAEALTLMMFPGSVPRFVEACGVWLRLVREGAVAASAPYRAWAAVTGQEGFDHR